MKIRNIIPVLAAVLLAVSCQDEAKVTFGLDTDNVAIGPEGGSRTIKVNSSGNWVAITQEPWITVSPANGNGSVQCEIKVDSSLVSEQRIGKVRIQGDDSFKEFTVTQTGFDYEVTLAKADVSISDYASYDKRSFDVVVKTNFDFDVVIPEGQQEWLSYEKDALVLDRGVRPRQVKVHFDWKINTTSSERTAQVSFKPVSAEIAVAKSDVLSVVQGAGPDIEAVKETAAGDSLALIAINRSLGCWTEYETAEKMEHWAGVTVWKSGKNKGRVRSAEFFLFGTKEGLPYEVRYLTAAEELYFYSNTNSFLLSLDCGEHITTLKQLRRLTIGAYGLTDLPASFANLENLEYLDLGSNNFQKIPEVLTKENFPKLTALQFTANQRSLIYDLSNSVKENIGGLMDETWDKDNVSLKKFPIHLLKWENLDTLRLSVNYLQGTLPTDAELLAEGFEPWTMDTPQIRDSVKNINDAAVVETLNNTIVGSPKVLPHTEFFAINLNRLYGPIPNWLLYHPKLDLWYPLSLVFPQEGKTKDGKSAGFDKEPTSLQYYYNLYTGKKNASSYSVDE